MAVPDRTSPPVTEHALSSLSDVYRKAGLEPADLDFYSTFDWFENLAANCLQEAEKAEVLACDGVVMPLRTRFIRLGPLSGIASRGLSNFYSCCFAPLGISSAEGAFPATASLGRHLRNRGIATLWFDALDETPKETLAAGLKHSG
jgi:hypothetical protein